jgi:O-antigen ligase
MIDKSKLLLIAAVAMGLAGLAAAVMFPALISDSRYLAALVFLELMVASLWLYEEIFFPFLLIVFLWAGMFLPLKKEMLLARWVVLGIGAWAGVIIWFRGKHQQKFGIFHLIALFFAIAAVLSAWISSAPTAALLKALSLFLLFLYASFGARVAFDGREGQLVRFLVSASELLAFGSAIVYFIFRYEAYGNPNSLGAVMGVVVIPVLLWDVLTNQEKVLRSRRMIALVLAAALLYRSLARASFLAAAIAVVLICLVLRQRLFLARAAFVVVVALALAGVADAPFFDQFVNSISSDLLYKGKSGQPVYISRVKPWNEAIESLERHPWFGSGFGTSENALDSSADSVASNGVHREHGNSYLALAEYMGVAGLLPFGVLLIILGRKLTQVWLWVWRSGNFRHYSVPLISIITAGLIHAIFEDWLIAPGFYLCILFWSFAFAVIHFYPPPLSQPVGQVASYRPGGGWGMDPRFAPFPPRAGIQPFR